MLQCQAVQVGKLSHRPAQAEVVPLQLYMTMCGWIRFAH